MRMLPRKGENIHTNKRLTDVCVRVSACLTRTMIMYIHTYVCITRHLFADTHIHILALSSRVQAVKLKQMLVTLLKLGE